MNTSKESDKILTSESESHLRIRPVFTLIHSYLLNLNRKLIHSKIRSLT